MIADNERIPTLVFVVRGFLFVPHYTHKGVYVGPGGVTARLSTLRENDMPTEVLSLWPRSWAIKEKLQGDHLL